MDLDLKVNYNIHWHFDVEIDLDLDQNWHYKLVLHILTLDIYLDNNVVVGDNTIYKQAKQGSHCVVINVDTNVVADVNTD